MNAYADTSFLISLYIEDANSAAADSLVRRHHPTFVLTPFGEAEFTNAVELRVFRQELTRAPARAVRDEFLSHLRAGIFHAEELGREGWQAALRLSRRHIARLGSRTLDLLPRRCCSHPQARLYFGRLPAPSRSRRVPAGPARSRVQVGSEMIAHGRGQGALFDSSSESRTSSFDLSVDIKR